MTPLRTGEFVVDSQKAAELIAEHRRLYAALHAISGLDDAVNLAQAALAATPEYDAFPKFVLASEHEQEMRIAHFDATVPLAETREELARLRKAAQALLEAWDQFNDPEVRVGPVWPRMRDLRAALNASPLSLALQSAPLDGVSTQQEGRNHG